MGSNFSILKSGKRRSSEARETRSNNFRNVDDDYEEIIEQYHHNIANNHLIDTIKKSKKQQTFFLKKYHIIKLENSDLLLQDECPICLEKLLVNDSIYLIPCCHYFHKECLKDWVMIENVCPSCRMCLGKNTAEEIDMTLFTREDKVNKAKKRYLLKLDLNQLNELLNKNNIVNDNLDKDNMIKKLMKINSLYQHKYSSSDEEIIDDDSSNDSSNDSSDDSSNDSSNDSSDDSSNDSSNDSFDSDKSIKIRYVNNSIR